MVRAALAEGGPKMGLFEGEFMRGFFGQTLRASGDEREAYERLGAVVRAHVESGRGSQVVVALTNSIGLVGSETGAWLGALRRVCAGSEALGRALRLWEAAVVFRKTGDERALLRLPVEERRILEGGRSHSTRWTFMTSSPK